MGDESIMGLSFEIGSTEMRDSWDLTAGWFISRIMLYRSATYI